MKLKFKIVIQFVFLLSISIIIFSSIVYNKTKEILEDSEKSNIRIISEKKSLEIYNWIEARKEDLRLIAALYISSPDRTDKISKLTDEDGYQGQFIKFGILEESNPNKSVSGFPLEKIKEDYKIIKETKVTLVSDPFLDIASGNKFFIISIPVIKKEKFLGVLFGLLNWKDFSEIIVRPVQNREDSGFLFNEEGLVLSHPRLELELKYNLLNNSKYTSEIKSIFENVIRSETRIAEFSVDGKQTYFSFSPVPGRKWIIGTSIPAQIVLKTLNEILEIALVSSIITILLSIIIAQLLSNNITRPIKLLHSGVSVVSKGIFDSIETEFLSKDEIGELGKTFNKMVDNIRGLVTTLESEKQKSEHLLNLIKRDLQIAQKIQNGMLCFPKTDSDKIKFFCDYSPRNEVGGDFYDIDRIGEYTYRIFIADATGHGVQAALVTMVIKAEYETLKRKILKGNELLEELNLLFCMRYSSFNSFFSCAVCDIDLKEEKILLSSAGHPDMLLWNSGSLEKIPHTGKIVGVNPGSKYKSVIRRFKPSDRIYMFSDGLYEEFNVTGELFGEDRLIEIINSNHSHELETACSNILKSLEQFLNGYEKQDDYTLIVVESL